MTELQQIKLLLVGLAEYLQLSITADQVQMYSSELSRDGLAFVAESIVAIKRSNNSFYGKFPLPAQIREIHNGNDEDYALESSLKIIKSVAKFGYTSPNEARDYIGRLGWSVVEAYGGWNVVCRSIDSPEKIGILQSQFKKSAQMMLSRSRVKAQDGASLIHESLRRNLNDNQSETVSLGAIIGGLLTQADDKKEDA